LKTKTKTKIKKKKEKKKRIFFKKNFKTIFFWGFFILGSFAFIYFAVSIKYKKKEREFPEVSNKTNFFKVYFLDAKTDKLVSESCTMKDLPSEDRKAEEIIKILLNVPKNKKLISPIPKSTKLLGIKITNGLAYVDFSREFLTNHPGGSTSEIMTINSVVSSLIRNVPQIKEVQFLVEGKKFNTIAGHINCKSPFKNEIKYE
jgi:spore germination protein GerM